MLRYARARLAALPIVVGVLGVVGVVGGCVPEPAAPAIGFSSNFGDTLFEAFLMDELERTRPEGGRRIRVMGSSVAFQGREGSPLSAEVRRATTLAEDPTVIVAVGPGGSREALQVAPIYRDAGLTELIPTATSRILAASGPTALLLAADDSVQGDFIGAFVDSVLHARAAVIIHVPDEYGVGLAAGTAAALVARGIPLTDRIPMRLVLDCTDSTGRAAHEAIADEAALRGIPDVAVLVMQTVEAGCLMRAMRSRFPKVRFVAGDGTDVEKALTDRAAGAAEGAFLVAFWHPTLERPGSRNFRERFETRVGRHARHGDAMFFDATMLAGAAIRAVGAHRDRVGAYLREIGTSRPAFEGITGPISFGADAKRTLLMTRIRGASTEVVR